MKTLLAAGLIALVAAIADASYVMGYNHGDAMARTDRAESMNACWDKTTTKAELYGCWAAN